MQHCCTGRNRTSQHPQTRQYYTGAHTSYRKLPELSSVTEFIDGAVVELRILSNVGISCVGYTMLSEICKAAQFKASNHLDIFLTFRLSKCKDASCE